MFRKSGRIGFSFGGGGDGGSSKIVLTLDDLVFINTQVSKRVSSVFNQHQQYSSLLQYFEST